MKTVVVQAPAAVVWEALTRPLLMKQWMAEPEIQIEIHTDWKVGSTIVIEGYHHKLFVNRGTVLQFDKPTVLRYTHLSSLSRLPDKPESYSVIEFALTSHENQTELKLTITNFPTESIFKHLDFYWSGTMTILKKVIEEREDF